MVGGTALGDALLWWSEGTAMDGIRMAGVYGALAIMCWKLVHLGVLSEHGRKTEGL